MKQFARGKVEMLVSEALEDLGESHSGDEGFVFALPGTAARDSSRKAGAAAGKYTALSSQRSDDNINSNHTTATAAAGGAAARGAGAETQFRTVIPGELPPELVVSLDMIVRADIDAIRREVETRWTEVVRARREMELRESGQQKAAAAAAKPNTKPKSKPKPPRAEKDSGKKSGSDSDKDGNDGDDDKNGKRKKKPKVDTKENDSDSDSASDIESGRRQPGHDGTMVIETMTLVNGAVLSNRDLAELSVANDNQMSVLVTIRGFETPIELFIVPVDARDIREHERALRQNAENNESGSNSRDLPHARHRSAVLGNDPSRGTGSKPPSRAATATTAALDSSLSSSSSSHGHPRARRPNGASAKPRSGKIGAMDSDDNNDDNDSDRSDGAVGKRGSSSNLRGNPSGSGHRAQDQQRLIAQRQQQQQQQQQRQKQGQGQSGAEVDGMPQYVRVVKLPRFDMVFALTDTDFEAIDRNRTLAERKRRLQGVFWDIYRILVKTEEKEWIKEISHKMIWGHCKPQTFNFAFTAGVDPTKSRPSTRGNSSADSDDDDNDNSHANNNNIRGRASLVSKQTGSRVAPAGNHGNRGDQQLIDAIKHAILSVAAEIPNSQRPLGWSDDAHPFDIEGIQFNIASGHAAEPELSPSLPRGFLDGTSSGYTFMFGSTAAASGAHGRPQSRASDASSRNSARDNNTNDGDDSESRAKLLKKKKSDEAAEPVVAVTGHDFDIVEILVDMTCRRRKSAAAAAGEPEHGKTAGGPGNGGLFRNFKLPWRNNAATVLETGSDLSGRMTAYLCRSRTTGQLFVSSLQLEDIWSTLHCRDALRTMMGEIESSQSELKHVSTELYRELEFFVRDMMVHQLRRAGLIVKTEPGPRKHDCCYLIGAPNSVLEKRAEAMHLLKLVAPQEDGTYVGGFMPEMFLRGGPLQPFWRASPGRPYLYSPYFVHPNSDDPETVFTSAERVRIVMDCIEAPSLPADPGSPFAEGGAEFDIRELISERVINDFLILNDLEELRELNNQWSLWRLSGNRIRDYFGEKMAFYFLFLRVYTMWLLLPGLMGVIAFFFAYSPLIYWFTASNEVIPQDRRVLGLYALIVTMGTTIFLEYWKRRTSYYSYLWGLDADSTRMADAIDNDPGATPVGLEVTLDASAAALALHGSGALRPSADGGIGGNNSSSNTSSGSSGGGMAAQRAAQALIAREDRVRPAYLTNLKEAYPSGRQLAEFFQQVMTRNRRPEIMAKVQAHREASRMFSLESLSAYLSNYTQLYHYPDRMRMFKMIASFSVCLAVTAILAIVVYVIFVLRGRNDNTSTQVNASTVLVSIANGLAIPLLNFGYKMLAMRLTEWEFHKTERDHDWSLYSKLFLFRFVNGYGSLFFIAFIARDLAVLTTQLASILIIGSITGNVLEICTPMLQRWWRERKLTPEERERIRKFEKPDVVKYYITQVGAEISRGTYGALSSSEDFLELILQFGYITFFVIVFPAAPFIALLNNIFEIKIDSHKVVNQIRRPFPAESRGIGIWLTILEFMSVVGVMTNIGLITITDTNRLKEMINLFCGADVYVVPDGVDPQSYNSYAFNESVNINKFPCTAVDYTWLIIVLEHALLAFKLILRVLIRDTSGGVRNNKLVELFYSITQNEKRNALIENRRIKRKAN